MTTPEEILEKHLTLMLGRTDMSFVSIEEMREQPEYQATIDAMKEYATKYATNIINDIE